AQAIQDHVAAGPGARRATAQGYFTDEDQLDAYLRDARASSTRRVSQVSDAHALVDAYLTRRATVWPHIEIATCAQQIKDRCSNHRLFQQGNLNLCGPASFLHMWAGRDPVGYARYAVGMLEHGQGRIGALTIPATAALEAMQYPRIGRPSTMTTPAADFVCMAPLRSDANAILPYDPTSGMEGLAGATTPGELAGWLRATGAFSTVHDEGNWMTIAGIDHAVGLTVGPESDIALLLNVNALAGAAQVTAIETPNTPITNPMTPDRSFFLNLFPNHFVTLLSGIVTDLGRTTLSLSIWTWGGSYHFAGVPIRSFSENYYGAVKTYMRS
ncbi:MAG: hypothetical protein H7138_14945, partial [Myxococcales bacterium]|nr:hypothetical protein [Myxococcales bacterium]